MSVVGRFQVARGILPVGPRARASGGKPESTRAPAIFVFRRWKIQDRWRPSWFGRSTGQRRGIPRPRAGRPHYGWKWTTTEMSAPPPPRL